jgi:hypothetical protein
MMIDSGADTRVYFVSEEYFHRGSNFYEWHCSWASDARSDCHHGYVYRLPVARTAGGNIHWNLQFLFLVGSALIALLFKGGCVLGYLDRIDNLGASIYLREVMCSF